LSDISLFKGNNQRHQISQHLKIEKKKNLKPTTKGGGGEGSVWKRSSFLISFFSPLSPSDCGSRGYLSWIELQDI